MKLVKKILNSKYYMFLKELFTLGGDKPFIVSSFTYYLLISLVPLATLSYYFLRLFGVHDYQLNQWILHYIPLLAENNSFSIANLFSNNISIIFGTLISVYIASKGLLNYFRYINQKYQLKQFKYSFIVNRIYTSFITLFFTLIFGLFIALRFSYLSSFFEKFKILSSISLSLGIFSIVLLLNYFLLKRKIKIVNLVLGSLFSTLLFELSSYILINYFNNFYSNQQYYGLFTDIIALLLYLYLLAYFLMLGNQLNLMIMKKRY